MTKYFLLAITLSAILLLPTHYTFADITTGLVGHWTFDEGSGTTAGDSSGNNNTGTLTSGPTWTTGQINGALSFDGSDDYVDILDSASLQVGNGSFTMGFWMRPNLQSAQTNIIGTENSIGSNQGWNIHILSNNKINVSANNGVTGFATPGVAGSLLTDATWTHIVATIDSGNTIGLYIDGSFVISTALSGATTFEKNYGLDIGNVETGGGRWFNGLIDDVRIYNRALTQSDITELYNYTGGTPPPTCTSFTYSAWSPVTCPVSKTQTRTITSSLPSGCTGGTSTTTQSCTYIPPVGDTQPPTIPTNLSATPISPSQINLSWSASTDNIGVTGYNIYRNGTQITTTSNTSYSNTGLTQLTTYTYTVSAYDAIPNTSSQSTQVQATTQATGAGTINAVSCSQADVQTAINSASDGDTVTVPPCPSGVVWTTATQNTPSVSIAKSITLQCAGVDSTVITDSTDIGDNGNEVAILVRGVSGRNVRITGFTFTGTGDSKGAIRVVGETTYFWKNMRIDNNKFTLSGSAITTTRAYGLIDNNTFDDPVRGLNNIMVFGIGIQSNSLSFSQPNPAGTDNAVYVEDNTFINPVDQNIVGEVDAFDGGHFVFRYNTVTNGGIQTHETAYTGLRGVRHYEIYSNTFSSNTTSNLARVMTLRGGTGVIYDNIFSGNYNNCVNLQNYRTNATQNVAGNWGWCDYTNTCDGNDPVYTNGYPCMDQIGRITDSGSGSASSCYQGGAGPGPTQVLDPLYAWNNKCLSGSYNASINVSNSCRNAICMTDHIQANRDYYDQTPKPGYSPYVYPHPLTQIGAVTLQADLNGDSIVNSIDWGIMNSAWGTADPTADINNDNIVNTLDWSIMNGEWGQSV